MSELTTFDLQPFQQGFYLSEAKYPLFAGGWGTGKSFTAILKCIEECRRYPDNLGMVGRKERTSLEKSTILDFQRYTNNFAGMKWREQAKELILYFDSPGGGTYSSKIMFLHVDTFSVIQNMNLGFAFIEQLDEIEDDGQTFDFITGRLRREPSSRSMFSTCNATADTHWIYKYWKTDFNKDDDNFKVYEANSFDNAKHLPADTLERWKKLKDRNEAMYLRYVESIWGVSDDRFILIPAQLLQALPALIAHPLVRRIVAVDPSSGGDEAVIFLLENGRKIDELCLYERDTMKLVAQIMIFCKKHKMLDVAIDTVGMGGPVADRLSELGLRVQRIHSAEKAEFDFLNRRAEMWWRAMEEMRDSKIMQIEDDELRRQLTSVHYEVNSRGKIKMEDKKKVRSRIGRSPDRADCYIYGLEGLRHVEPYSLKPADYDEEPAQAGSSWMAA